MCLMLEAKKNGYSDVQIAACLAGNSTEDDARQKRIAAGIKPRAK